MQRLLEASVTVLLLSTVINPVQANPAPSARPVQPVVESAVPSVEPSAPVQPTVPTQTQAQRTPDFQAEAETTETLSDRDRLILERREQRLIPTMQ